MKCPVCTSCVAVREGARNCVFGGPFSGYRDARPDDGRDNAKFYFTDERLTHLAAKPEKPNEPI